MTEGRCDCGDWVDSRGRHRAACPHSGRLRTRATAPEANVRFKCLLRDMNVAVRAEDERRIEVLASGLPIVLRSSTGRGHHLAERPVTQKVVSKVTHSPSFFVPHFCPNVKFSAVLSLFFFSEGVRIETHVHFGSFFVPPNPKLNRTTKKAKHFEPENTLKHLNT